MSQRTRAVFEALKEGAAAVGREAIMPALEKLVPQGAAELSHALMTGQVGYVPYGPTEMALERPGETVAKPEITSFDDKLKAPVQEQPEQERGNEMEM